MFHRNGRLFETGNVIGHSTTHLEMGLRMVDRRLSFSKVTGSIHIEMLLKVFVVEKVNSVSRHWIAKPVKIPLMSKSSWLQLLSVTHRILN